MNNRPGETFQEGRAAEVQRAVREMSLREREREREVPDTETLRGKESNILPGTKSITQE